MDILDDMGWVNYQQKFFQKWTTPYCPHAVDGSIVTQTHNAVIPPGGAILPRDLYTIMFLIITNLITLLQTIMGT